MQLALLAILMCTSLHTFAADNSKVIPSFLTKYTQDNEISNVVYHANTKKFCGFQLDSFVIGQLTNDDVSVDDYTVDYKIFPYPFSISDTRCLWNTNGTKCLLLKKPFLHSFVRGEKLWKYVLNLNIYTVNSISDIQQKKSSYLIPERTDYSSSVFFDDNNILHFPLPDEAEEYIIPPFYENIFHIASYVSLESDNKKLLPFNGIHKIWFDLKKPIIALNDNAIKILHFTHFYNQENILSLPQEILQKIAQLYIQTMQNNVTTTNELPLRYMYGQELSDEEKQAHQLLYPLFEDYYRNNNYNTSQQLIQKAIEQCPFDHNVLWNFITYLENRYDNTYKKEPLLHFFAKFLFDNLILFHSHFNVFDLKNNLQVCSVGPHIALKDKTKYYVVSDKFSWNGYTVSNLQKKMQSYSLQDFIHNNSIKSAKTTEKGIAITLNNDEKILIKKMEERYYNKEHKLFCSNFFSKYYEEYEHARHTQGCLLQ